MKFNQDLKLEHIISAWIEENHFIDKPNRYEYRRCSDLISQRRGIDAKLKSLSVLKDNLWHSIDEKAASNYMKFSLEQESLPTFAFELDCKKKNSANTEDRVPGWLFGNQYSDTEYYLISWLWAKKKKSAYNYKFEDLLKAECYLISKNDIHKYLHDFGINHNTFIEKSKKIRDSKKNRMYLSNNSGAPYLYYTDNRDEKPVNVIIKKWKLKEMAIDTFIVEN